MHYPLVLGCTKARHAQIGVDAIINARGGLQCLNDQTIEDIELARDARAVRDHQEQRVRFYNVHASFWRRKRNRKHLRRLSRLFARHDD